jgi:hypothetical protein
VEQVNAQFLRLRDSKVSEMQLWGSRAEALDAVGLEA